MTDLDVLKDMLARFGINYSTFLPGQNSGYTNGERTREGVYVVKFGDDGIGGHFGSVAIFVFSKEGKYLESGSFE